MIYLIGSILLGAASLLLLSATTIVPIPLKFITFPASVLCLYYCGKYGRRVLEQRNRPE